jgi:enoyl-CoA hydratase/carnithine racemase
MPSPNAVAQQRLQIHAEGGIVRLTMDHPQTRNALSQALIQELETALLEIADDATARVVVIAARGPVFSSGHDLNELVGRSEADYQSLFAACSRMMERLHGLPQPVIARVQGHALAAGCQLVAACDLAVAAEGATFSTPGVKIGLFCTTPMVPLVRAVPAKAAMEMLLTGTPISAARAYELGLVNRVVPDDMLDVAVRALTEPILASSPLTIQLGKAAFYDQIALEEHEAYERATDVMTQNALRHDAQEGISAFLQKRKPEWKGQ